MRLQKSGKRKWTALSGNMPSELCCGSVCLTKIVLRGDFRCPSGSAGCWHTLFHHHPREKQGNLGKDRHQNDNGENCQKKGEGSPENDFHGHIRNPAMTKIFRPSGGVMSPASIISTGSKPSLRTVGKITGITSIPKMASINLLSSLAPEQVRITDTGWLRRMWSAAASIPAMNT